MKDNQWKLFHISVKLQSFPFLWLIQYSLNTERTIDFHKSPDNPSWKRDFPQWKCFYWNPYWSSVLAKLGNGDIVRQFIMNHFNANPILSDVFVVLKRIILKLVNNNKWHTKNCVEFHSWALRRRQRSTWKSVYWIQNP